MDIQFEKQIVDFYLETKSMTKTANFFGVDRTKTVKKILHKNDIEVINYQNKARFNINYFDVIDSEEKAYWLGFLLADGNVSSTSGSITVGLKLEDKLHLEKLKNSIGCINPVRVDTKNGRNRCRFCFGSNYTKHQVSKFGLVPKKTYKLKFPENIPLHLKRHLIRGYFDGDGFLGFYNNGLNSYRASLIGTEDFLKEVLFNCVLESNISILNKNRGGDSRIKVFQLTGKNAYNFTRFLYENSTIYLERKYNIYQFAVQTLKGLNYDCEIKQEGCDTENKDYTLKECSICKRKLFKNKYYEYHNFCKDCLKQKPYYSSQLEPKAMVKK